MLTHGALLNLLHAQRSVLGVRGKGGRVAQFASLSFDASVEEWAKTLTRERRYIWPVRARPG